MQHLIAANAEFFNHIKFQTICILTQHSPECEIVSQLVSLKNPITELGENGN